MVVMGHRRINITGAAQDDLTATVEKSITLIEILNLFYPIFKYFSLKLADKTTTKNGFRRRARKPTPEANVNEKTKEAETQTEAPKGTKIT